jgi:hypothetical protein
MSMKLPSLLAVLTVGGLACGELAAETPPRVGGGKDASSTDVGSDGGRSLESGVDAVGATDSILQDATADVGTRAKRTEMRTCEVSPVSLRRA